MTEDAVETIWTVHMTEPYSGLYINLYDSSQRAWQSAHLVPTKTSLTCKFAYLLNLPPTNLECLPLSDAGKDPDARKNLRQKEKGMTEDEMIEWHHRLNGHEFEQILGDGEGQGGLVCCSPWGRKESDMTEQLN